jgi:uncharacterized protein GlcG (DUF336 family)
MLDRNHRPGRPLSFERQDGAIAASVELAINKAFTAQIFNIRTDRLNVLAQPEAELVGIQHSNNELWCSEEGSQSSSKVRRSARSV